MKLGRKRELELIADYRAGVKRDAIMKKYRVNPPKLYDTLRKYGVQANRKPTKYNFFCVVCGEPRPLPPYHPSAVWRSMPTCGDEACKSVILFRPDLRVREVPLVPPGRHKRPSRAFKMWNDLVDFEVADEINRLTDAELAAIERAFTLGVDERAADVSEVALQALYGRFSEVTIAVRMVGQNPAETTLTLDADTARGAFFRMYFGDDAPKLRKSVESMYDVLFLWRCACPEQTVYVIRKPEDFPKEPGEYGVCGRCGAAALELV
jgi:hypothetical protein